MVRDWYYAAQHVQYVDDEQVANTIFEEDEGTEGRRDNRRTDSSDTSPSEDWAEENKSKPTRTKAEEAADRRLAREEVYALICCFIGPVVGAYLLHALRTQLTRDAEGLVSNFNLTIFIMAAELRPVQHVIKMKQARMVHLQRIAHPHDQDLLGRAEAGELSQRLAEIEARLTGPVSVTDAETTKLSATIHQSLQPQLDALNRAVRRYEKRQAALSMQNEARFRELETRLKDALALAAAAARTGQQSGIASMASTWIVNAVTNIARMAWAVAMFPLRVAASISSRIKSLFIRTERPPKRRLRVDSAHPTSVPVARSKTRN
jgi:hypothetical protein